VRQYIIRRLLQAVLILFVLSILVFILLRIAPGLNPALVRCGLNCTPDIVAALEEEMGLNDPYFPITLSSEFPFIGFSSESQYTTWLSDLFSGSLGVDWNGGSVREELERRFPTTLELLIITVIFTTIIGVPFGIISAIKRNSPADFGVRMAAIGGLAIPGFWIAVMVLLIPQALWNYAPPLTHTVGFFEDPWDNLRQFVPVGIVLGALSAAGVMRLTRSSMLEVMRQDYVRTARSKGLREQVVIGRHALKNAMIPVVTILGLEIAGLFGGAVIAETIFNLNGIGQYFLSALFRRDYQVVQTLTLYIGVIVILMNLLVDIVYAWLDPRIRYS
jgi:peptide/nickel transport system permease protein